MDQEQELAYQAGSSKLQNENEDIKTAAKKIIELWEDCWLMPIGLEQVADRQVENLFKKRKEVRQAIVALRKAIK